jgi:hypothetical protein
LTHYTAAEQQLAEQEEQFDPAAPLGCAVGASGTLLQLPLRNGQDLLQPGETRKLSLYIRVSTAKFKCLQFHYTSPLYDCLAMHSSNVTVYSVCESLWQLRDVAQMLFLNIYYVVVL